MRRDNVKLTGIVVNVLAIVIVSAILIGATFAWFTDNAVSSGNKIQAGTLKVDLELLDKDNGWTSIKSDNDPIFDYDRWEPGYTSIKILKIENEGTLAFKWKAKLASTGNLSQLADVIDVYVLSSDAELAYPDSRALEGYSCVGTVREFITNMESTITGILFGGESSYLGLALKMRTDVGNEYQALDLGGSLDIVISAAQTSEETDGIGSDYDTEATYPVAVCNAQALKDAMLQRNAIITLDTDIVVDSSTPLQWGSYMFVANGREVTIDLNGHDIIFDETASSKVLFMFTTANGGILNIVGDGNIITRNGETGIFWGMNPNDQINIYSGNFIVEGVAESQLHDKHPLYVNRGRINVYGGRFYYPEGMRCANAEDAQGNRLGIVFYEGALLQQSTIQWGDDSRIQLAENCSLVEVDMDGETWYQVCCNN